MGDEHAAKGFLHGRALTWFVERFAGADEGDLPLARLARDVAECCRRIGIALVHVAAWSEMQADPVRAPDRYCRIDGLEHQARAVLDRSAVGIGPLVRAILKELIEQV